MKVGDLVQRIRLQSKTRFKGSGFNSLAIIVGFDDDGDLRLRHANAKEGWENMEDVDYRDMWGLVNACD